jgi:hypothetical protein
MFGLFSKEKFRPQNGFSALASVPTENQIKIQKLKNAQGKLECYILYATYISLFTSTQFPKYADKIDQLLVNGIWSYRNFLKIGESPFILGFPHYVESRSKFYMECINEVLENFNGKDGATLPTFVMLFETNDVKEIDEVDVSDLFHIMAAFQTVKINLELIHNGYEIAAECEKMSVSINPEDFYFMGSTLIEDLVVLPFRKPRCEHCGSLKQRSELYPVFAETEYGQIRIAVCPNCKSKYKY